MNKKPFIKALKKYFILTGILLIVLIVLFESQISPFEEKCVLKQSKAVSNRIINEAVDNTLKKYKFSYDDLARLNYSDSGDVKAISTNSYNINRIKSDVILNIQNKLDKSQMHYFKMPVGAFTQINSINNFGPDVELNFRLTGSAKCKIYSEFESAGFNQTIHHIYLIVTTNMIVISPKKTTEKIYKADFEIAQTVIVGDIPSTYANIK